MTVNGRNTKKPRLYRQLGKFWLAMFYTPNMETQNIDKAGNIFPLANRGDAQTFRPRSARRSIIHD